MEWVKCNEKFHEIAFLFTLSINQINDQFFLERYKAMRMLFCIRYGHKIWMRVSVCEFNSISYVIPYCCVQLFKFYSYIKFIIIIIFSSHVFLHTFSPYKMTIEFDGTPWNMRMKYEPLCRLLDYFSLSFYYILQSHKYSTAIFSPIQRKKS